MAKNGTKHDRFVSPAAGVVFLLILALLLFVAVSFLLRHVGLLTFPEFLENILTEEPAETESTPGEYSSLYDALRDELPKSNGAEVNIDPSMLTELFIGMAPPEKYYQRISISTSYDGENFRNGESEILFDNGNFTVKLSEGGETVKTVLGNGNAIRTSGASGGLARTFSSVSGRFSAADEAGIPDLSYIGGLIKEFTEGGSSDITNYSVTRTISEEGNFLNITFEYTELGLIEAYVISLYDNVIRTAESRSVDGVLYYKAETVEFTTDIEGRS